MSRIPLVLAVCGMVSAAADAKGFSDKESIGRMYWYGRCVAALAPSQSRRVLSLAPGSKEERALLHKIATDRCISGQGQVFYLDFEPQMLRGLIAEEILGLDAGSKSVHPKGEMAAPFPPLTAADIAGLDERGRAALRALDLAECLLGVAPAPVATLLTTGPASPQEARAFQQLGPHLGPCLPKGARMTVAKPQLRGFLAEAAYRQAYAAAHEPQVRSQEAGK